MKWCAGCARGIGCVGRWTRGGCTVSDLGAAGHAQRLRLTRPGGHATAGRRGRRPLRATAERTLQHTTRQMRFSRASQMVRGRCPRDCIRWAMDARRAHRLYCGQNRSRPTDASDLARQSHGRGAPRTVHPTGGCETNVAAWNVTGVENHTQTARPPYGSDETYLLATTVGGGVPDAPFVG